MAGPVAPAQSDKEWRYKNLDEASRNTRGIFYLYLGALAYCFLTVVGTSDRQLLLGEKTRLPFLNMEVSLYGFFIVAPLLLMLVYSYLQLYLHHMNGLKMQLRASGGWEYRRAYPWMINIADDPEHGSIGRAQRYVVGLTLWASLPVVLEVFYLWILKRHDKYLSVTLYYESALGMVLVFYFWWKYRARSKFAAVSMSAALSALFFFPHLLFGPIWPYLPKQIVGRFDPRNLNVSFQNLVDERNVKYPELPLVDLRNSDLRWANLTSCVLMRADLRGAKMQHARLERANLRGAWLNSTNLDSADLSQAVLDSSEIIRSSFVSADLESSSISHALMIIADLQGADLTKASIRGTELTEVKFRGSYLRNTDLSRANLFRVDLCGVLGHEFIFLSGAKAENVCFEAGMSREFMFDSADLGGAVFKGDFEAASFRAARLNSAILDGAGLKNADFTDAILHRASLRGADLRWAILLGAGLGNADLERANLSGAFLDSADLTGAVLSNAVMFSKDEDNGEVPARVKLGQLAKAKTLYQSILDPAVVATIPRGSKVWRLMHYPWPIPEPGEELEE